MTNIRRATEKINKVLLGFARKKYKCKLKDYKYILLIYHNYYRNLIMTFVLLSNLKKD